MRAVAGVIYSGNGAFDAGKAKAAGLDGVIFKAVGVNGEDSRFKANALRAQTAGLPWAAGTWPDVTRTPQEQAAIFHWVVASAGAGEPPLPPSLDLEEAPAGISALALAGWYRAYIDDIERRLGVTPCIYTLDNFWNVRVAPAGIDFTDCTIRVADYRGRTRQNPAGEQPPKNPDDWEGWLARQREPQPDAVVGFVSWDAWQFSADGNGLGVLFGLPTADISLNVVKDEAWYRWLPSAAPPLPPDPELVRLRADLAAAKDRLTAISSATAAEAAAAAKHADTREALSSLLRST